ncbi:MAG: hypothetical protein LUI02_05650 [Clostridiales bacterium]|nr:hypothetical protein [Clostridiales bacterium]
MKTNGIPAIITLVAAAIDCVISLISRVTLMVFLRRLLIVLIVFYVIGCIVKVILDLNFPETEEEKAEEEAAEGEEAEAGEDEAEEETVEGEEPEEGEADEGLENIDAEEDAAEPKAG